MTTTKTKPGKTMPRAKKTAEPKMTPAIKGFNSDLTYLGHQFETGKTYRHEGRGKCCAGGFHVITDHPLAVFNYYPPAGSRFCRVEIGGAIHSDDNIKTAAEILKVGQEIGISELVAEAIRWVTDRATPEGESATGYQGAASATGYRGAASATGDQGAASATGDKGAASATGDKGAASATGDQGAASATGYRGAASATGGQGAASATGYQGAASATGGQGAASATGYRGAASATGDQGAASATGYQGAASATGYQGAASATGYWGAASATGYQGAAMSIGVEGTVKGAIGNALFAAERKVWSGPVLSVACGIVGQDGIKPDRWYRAVGGKLVAA